MTRAQTRKLVIFAVLLLLLLALGGYYAYYNATHQLSFNITASTSHRRHPAAAVPLLVCGRQVQAPATDRRHGGRRHRVRMRLDGSGTSTSSTRPGNYKGSFGTSETVIPLYIAKNPTNNVLYVTRPSPPNDPRFDRGREISSGTSTRTSRRTSCPRSRRGGVQWEPVALAFAPDGTMYVTEILNGHRLLIFDPDGTVQEVGRQRRHGHRPVQGARRLPIP